MKLLTISLLAWGGAIALSLSPVSPARAQDAMTQAAPAPPHGDWTLREREDWLSDRLDKSRADGSLDRSEFENARRQLADLKHEEGHMRDEAHGQLTDNQTADLEQRLDAMAEKIHWANANTYTRPW
jgi:hypothetical protein